MSSIPNLKRQAIVQRSRARRLLLQTLYQWQLNHDEPRITYLNRIIDSSVGDIDESYFDEAYQYITDFHDEIEQRYAHCANRTVAGLDPVERAILWIGIYELCQRPDIHPKIVINEAVELAKQFGADESYKFVNATLDNFVKSRV